MQELGKIAAELDISVGNLALAWILRQSNVASALVGASRPEQVEENVKASGVELGDEVLSRIAEIMD
ncbi:L-glyceraldehyde 3-phosphate reductase [compost metagenome]